jgi:hypothetical protein
MLKRIVCLLGLAVVLAGCVYDPGYGEHEHYHHGYYHQDYH